MLTPPRKRPPPPSASSTDVAPTDSQADALNEALRRLLEPLAKLAIARGVPYAALDDLMKSTFVEAARAAHPGLPEHRMVSRISTTTGLNRREVTRLTTSSTPAAEPRHSPATRVFTKWLADPALRDRSGPKRKLPRTGAAPSFESLAQSVTRDVHPRSLLDELQRLGLVRADGEEVHLLQDRFAPKDDSARMLGFLGNNVGDHLQAAVANVLAEGTPPHLEQAVFADGLSDESVDEFRALMRTQWQTLLSAAAPALQKLLDGDRAAQRRGGRRVRVGLYTFDETMVEPVERPARPPRRKKEPG